MVWSGRILVLSHWLRGSSIPISGPSMQRKPRENISCTPVLHPSLTIASSQGASVEELAAELDRAAQAHDSAKADLEQMRQLNDVSPTRCFGMDKANIDQGFTALPCNSNADMAGLPPSHCFALQSTVLLPSLATRLFRQSAFQSFKEHSRPESAQHFHLTLRARLLTISLG